MEFLKLWRSSFESQSVQSGVKNLILKCQDSSATDYLRKCFTVVNANNSCLKGLETLNFYPSENEHPSQFAILEEILAQNLSSLKQIRVRALLGAKSLANVDLRRFTNLQSFIINCFQVCESEMSSEDFD